MPAKRKKTGMSEALRTTVEKAVVLYNSGKPDKAVEHLLSSGSGWKTDPDAVFLLFLASDAVGDEISFENSLGYARAWLELSFGGGAAKYMPSKVLSSDHPEGLFAVMASERLLMEGEVPSSDMNLVRKALWSEKVRSETPMAVFHSSTIEFESGNFEESARLMTRFLLEVEREAASSGGTASCSAAAFHRAPTILSLALFASGKYEEGMECLKNAVIPAGIGLYREPAETGDEDDEYDEAEGADESSVELPPLSAGMILGEGEAPEAGKEGRGPKMFGSAGPVIPFVSESPEERALRPASSSTGSGPKMFPSVFRLPDGSYIKAF